MRLGSAILGRSCLFAKADTHSTDLSERGKSMLEFFFYQNICYKVQTNNLQSTKINQKNMIKMSQTINITLQPM